MDVKDFCTGIQHIGIPTNNIKETIEFYERLGFIVELQTKNNEEQVAFLRLHNVVIETYENKQAAMCDGSINHVALDVKNIDGLFALMKEKGFRLLDEQVNKLPFWKNGVKFFTIQGPNNERIEFCEKL